MDDRRSQILKAIIEAFIDSASPIGSQYLLSSGKFEVSAATIRNDMAELEDIGLIFQPHTSAGRIPTEQGFRLFVDELMDDFPDQVVEKEMALADWEELRVHEADRKIRNAVSMLARLARSVSFATLPWMDEAYYLGIANVLKSKEFENEPLKASTIIEILEDKDRFIELLGALPITKEVRAFIGEENTIPGIQSCTLLVTSYQIGKHRGAIGLLGPTRMRYAYNMKLLESVRDDMSE